MYKLEKRIVDFGVSRKDVLDGLATEHKFAIPIFSR